MSSSRLQNISAGCFPFRATLVLVGFLLCPLLLLPAFEAPAQIIPFERRITWSPGIPGGIPQRTTTCANVKNSPYNAKGDGVNDDTAAIQRAIDNCPNGQVVYIPAGTYRLTGELRISGKSIVLRGDGQRRTHLRNYAASGHILSIYIEIRDEFPVNIVSGYTKDSTAIIVENASSLNAGDYIVVYQDNDPELPVDPTGCGGTCTWCGLNDDENHAMTQIVRITAKSGNNLSLNRPLYYTFKATQDPEVLKLSMMERAGVEDMTLEMAQVGSGTRNGIQITQCAHCWIRNVETYKVRNHHVSIRNSYGNEVRQSYFHHGWGNYPGDWAYGVMLHFVNSDHLIEDNIFYVLRHSMVLEGGGSGNVLAYNYSKDSQGNIGDHWLFADMGTHGAHPYMNLVEGNVIVQLDFDGHYGSGSHNTAFRNWIERRSSPPEDIINSGLFAVVLGAKNRFINVVGNVLCHPGCTGVYQAPAFVDAEIWHLGYLCAGSQTSTDPQVEATLIRHGNFDYLTNTTKWDPGIADHNFPPSYYLASKPAFFGSLAWPAIGPDLNPMVGQLPARARFEAMTELVPPPLPDAPVSAPASTSGGGGCFIARAAFGSDKEPQVKVLRAFRDRFMMSHPVGRVLVDLYYCYSPVAANFMERHDVVKAIVRWALLPLINICSLMLNFGVFETMMLLAVFVAGMAALARYGLRLIGRRRLRHEGQIGR
ncbi:MAG TPA: glycosyl hydrolase family 28-related protein [Syntrophales bacterium]|jgi:hypothetical protein|nr:glycosyl hydrolase family 28-related protein [Syntrophales bacterium]